MALSGEKFVISEIQGFRQQLGGGGGGGRQQEKEQR